MPFADIPLIGPVLELLDYMVRVVTLNGAVILSLATPLALGALCGFMNERSGVVNIGIEGTMLAAAFCGWFAASIAVQSLPAEPSWAFGATPAILVGVLAALAAGLAISALHAWLCISLRADQIISGTIINIVAVGITGYLSLLLSSKAMPTAGKFVAFRPPKELVDLPVIGWVIKMFLQQGPITMSVIVLAIVLQILLFRSRWGLRTRAVGEHPKAAETVGIDVIAMRYRNVILGGLFAGLAGAWFTLENGTTFQSGMTNGRGFIALAALIFGRWMPLGAFAAALLFAATSSLGLSIRVMPPPGGLGAFMTSIPEQFWFALPYLVTIIVLAGAVGRSRPPAAVGKPYQRESVT
jgi:simple sugar transport system permease protein